MKLGVKILSERLFTIFFWAAVGFTVLWAFHFLTGWSPPLRRF
jgi:hypothetical protein